MTTLNLPAGPGKLAPYSLKAPRAFPVSQPPFSRVAFAAAHVVADPLADNDPWLAPAIDWERTIAFRRHLWSLGFGVAEAMDTAQRGMGLDWKDALELIRRSLDAAKHGPAVGAGLVAGLLAGHAERTGATPALCLHPLYRAADQTRLGAGAAGPRPVGSGAVDCR